MNNSEKMFKLLTLTERKNNLVCCFSGVISESDTFLVGGREVEGEGGGAPFEKKFPCFY